jgi:two-component system NtrC family sensor kinase
MRLAIRGKLVLLSLVILVVVSFAFTLLDLNLARRLVEEDLAERAVAFAREIAATIGDRQELESGAILQRQIQEVLAVRRNVLQLDIFTFVDHTSRVVATSHPGSRLPFTRVEAVQVQQGRVVSRLIVDPASRHWEVIAPVTLEGVVAGAVAAKFSLDRADAVAAGARRRALLLTALSVVVMGGLMGAAVHGVVIRPIRRFLHAVHRVERGDTTATVELSSRDEFGELARHFNDMMRRLRDFNDELQARVKEATAELEGRYREVERLNEQLFSLQRSLGHAERLALAGRVMAEVAHEVGTPLHSVSGHLELLRRELPVTVPFDGVQRRLDVIESQLKRVTGIIGELLDLTRREPGSPVAVDLNHLVLEMVDVVRPAAAQRGLVIETTTAAALPSVWGHPNPLQQVVLNLLTNAIDATSPGGRVWIVTRARARGVELEVTDTGRGIPAAEQRRIFEPFFSTKEGGRGSGLGLFVAAQIVREHKGRIEVVSAEGRGASFRVMLPASSGQP